MDTKIKYTLIIINGQNIPDDIITESIFLANKYNNNTRAAKKISYKYEQYKINESHVIYWRTNKQDKTELQKS